MKKPLYFILCLLTLMVFLLIFIQRQWHPFKTTPLNGVGEEVHFPDDIGFREPLIRVYNQYLWDCHHQTNVESILVGKQHYLYNTDFVDDFLGLHWQNYAPDFTTLHNNLRLEASRLKKVQDILAEYGKTLFVILEPSKVRVYPEYLPDRITPPENNLTAADLYPVLFDSLGVNYINTKRLRIVYPMPFIPSWALIGPTLPPCMSPTPFCATWNDKETSPCHNFPSAKPCMTPP